VGEAGAGSPLESLATDGAALGVELAVEHAVVVARQTATMGAGVGVLLTRDAARFGGQGMGLPARDAPFGPFTVDAGELQVFAVEHLCLARVMLDPGARGVMAGDVGGAGALRGAHAPGQRGHSGKGDEEA